MSPRWKTLLSLIVPVKQMEDKLMEFAQVSNIAEICCCHLYKFSYSQLKEAGACDAIHLASINGIGELFKMLMRPPNMIHFIDDEFGRGLLQNAIIHRQERIFDILCQRGLNNQVTGHVDENDNNVLHCAGFWEPSPQLDKVYGATLQMQREIQWYQEVEKMDPQKYKQMKNKDGLKPKALFTKEHEDLLKQGSAWVKDTSQACMLVATLIATVMF
ncbi:uncharacterized protein LOC113344695 isoform X1 [Papaver somniferum]|uniref:uncharacterized protein LOC113344695 isoform X1 n=1 Tax=Papaver somniferum TaxID=3469 RepID=UPI000E700206|nr:uncharacterized protein LOC113344695 isoform X1 [Papaver somniferum]XP_026444407.1 uncharacterized protein LOC113344695 isoform X1 [Papaver somniferum]